MSTEANQDKWAAWLQRGRFGNDEATRVQALERLNTVRDRVLKNASLCGQEVFLDVGTGEGFIGLGAMELLRPPRGEVIFTDISQPCLDYVARFVDEYYRNIASSFKRVPADDLIGIPNETIDVVTTRSVLIYVKNKRQAFHEFFRVLRPGGRISLAEPINRDHVVLAAREWCAWEDTHIALAPGYAPSRRFEDPAFRLALYASCYALLEACRVFE